jgi:hypothetical protein
VRNNKKKDWETETGKPRLGGKGKGTVTEMRDKNQGKVRRLAAQGQKARSAAKRQSACRVLKQTRNDAMPLARTETKREMETARSKRTRSRLLLTKDEEENDWPYRHESSVKQRRESLRN